ncbi:MAG: ligase-associated DNA damage response exonuclease [Desulfosarcinaceae bacterium]|nr:ligase-associated DNA damage response exonuclease [Desulfosarcinaceae bacterium]
MLDSGLQITPKGLYCPEGDFYIDPVQPVPRAVITHAHADHARPGSRDYLCAMPGRDLLQARLGAAARIESMAYGDRRQIGGVTLSLHPAGHILGSAQIRIERGGRVSVVSGDYKTDPDPTCTPLTPLTCHHFISESTFGLPIFKWPAYETVMAEINAWWAANRDEGLTSVLFVYALGKAQRVLAGLDPAIGPILTHGAVEKVTATYRNVGVALPATRHVDAPDTASDRTGALVLAPPSAHHPAWMRRFRKRATAFASGWMRIRGHRRRRAVDRGFVISDHSDWEGLVATVTRSGADWIGLTHGYAAEMARWLQDQGHTAEVIDLSDRPAPDRGDRLE